MKNLNFLISVQHLDVKCSIKKTLIKDVNIEINNKDYIAIVGANGAGKSTFIEYLTKQRFSSNISFAKNLKISYVPQFSLIEQSVDFFLNACANMMKCENHLSKVVEAFSLEELLKLKMHEISAGERQRVILALNFLREPDVIVLDEFSVGLDIEARKQFVQLVKNLKKKYNFALIMVSHNDDMINELVDKVFAIENNELKEVKHEK